MKHISGIKKTLGISGIMTKEAGFIKRKDDLTDGCQIDLLIDRADNCINICEMKFSDSEYILSNDDVKNIQRKKQVFQTVTNSKKQIFITLVSPFGIYQNSNTQFIDQVIDNESLF